MAEQSFFASEEDHESLVNLLVTDYDAAFVRDGSSPNDAPLKSVDAVMSTIHGSSHDPRFFVISPQWQLEPLQFGELQLSNGATRYFVQARYGGPAFDYLARRIGKNDQGNQLVASWLSCFSHYYSLQDPSHHLPRPPAMTIAFRAIRNVVARGGKRTDIQEIQRPGPMAMRHARVAFDAGTWLRVGDWHHVPRRDA